MPNKNRHLKKLERLREHNKNLELKDIIKSQHITYRFEDKITWEKVNINFKELEKHIIKFLEKININNQVYQKYVTFLKRDFKEKQLKISENRKILTLRMNNLINQRNELWKYRNEEEDEIYSNKLNQFNEDIEKVKNKISEIWDNEDNNIRNFEIFVNIIRDSSNYYKKATYVQKRKICRLLFLNIIVNSQNQVIINGKRWLEWLFSANISKFKESWIWTSDWGAEDLRVPRLHYPLIQKIIYFLACLVFLAIFCISRLLFICIRSLFHLS